MTRDEAARILAVLTAAWPRHEMPRETVQLWLGMLAELEEPDAMAAARDVVRQDHWFPSIARFLQASTARKHARLNRQAAVRGLPEAQGAPPNPELMAATRRLIGEREGQRHNHKGPDPCPVCGGVKRRREAS